MSEHECGGQHPHDHHECECGGQHSHDHSTHSSCETCNKEDCPSANQRPNENEEEFLSRQRLQSRLCRIQHKIVVMSGKGGVGKSTVSANLAAALTLAGKRVGLLDVDIHGPSIPTMLGIEGESIQGDEEGLHPFDIHGLKVVSLGLFLPNSDDAVIWRGPRKMAVIQQFLSDVVWGDLDFLIIDSPPGTGDEPLSVCQLIENIDGAIIVTTPQHVAAVNVRKSVSFCKLLNVPVLGIIENMSGFICPHCNQVSPIFFTGGGEKIAEDMEVPFLGAIPIDMNIAKAGDEGISFLSCYANSPTAKIMQEIIRPIQNMGK